MGLRGEKMQICAELAIRDNENKRHMLVDVWVLRRAMLNLGAEKNSFGGWENRWPETMHQNHQLQERVLIACGNASLMQHMRTWTDWKIDCRMRVECNVLLHKQSSHKFITLRIWMRRSRKRMRRRKRRIKRRDTQPLMHRWWYGRWIIEDDMCMMIYRWWLFRWCVYDDL